jgi:hypothetical protein
MIGHQGPIIVPVDGEIRLDLRFTTEISSPIEVQALLKYHHALRSHQTYKASLFIRSIESGKTVSDLLQMPTTPTFIPSICSVYLTVDGDAYPEIKLDPVKVVTLETYFEHVVSEDLEQMNFVAERHGDTDPDVVAHPKTVPQEIFNVECTMQEKYDVDKFDKDYAKFRYETYKWKFMRLLIVSYSKQISSGVIDRMAEHRETNIGLIRYQDLKKLVQRHSDADLSDEQILLKLMQRGEIVFNEGSIEVPELRTRRTIDITYKIE